MAGVRPDDETNLWLAQALYDLGGLRFGEFTIGRTTINSPVYVNPRVLISNPEALRRVARLIDREIQAGMSRKRDPIQPFDLVAGVPLGGLHLATAYALTTNTPMIYVRPSGSSSTSSISNGHGIEGRFTAGQRVLLIDDLITTGGSILQTRQALESADLIVKDVVVLIDREQGGAENLHHSGYELLPIVSLRAMLTYYVNTGRMDEDLYDSCMAYLEQHRS